MKNLNVFVKHRIKLLYNQNIFKARKLKIDKRGYF